MSISGVDGDFSYSPDFSSVDDIYDGYVDNDVYDVGISVIDSNINLNPEEIERRVKKRSFVIGLVAGAIVMAIALTIAVIAVTSITGIPQTLVMGIALAGLTVGGVTILRNMIDLIKLKRSKNLEDESQGKKRALKFAAVLGSLLLSFGLSLRLGASFITTPFKNLVSNIGVFTNKMGVSSLFSALGCLLFENINGSDSVKPAEVSDEINNKRILTGAALALTIGMVFIALGVVMLIFGSTALVGVPQAILLAFAPPLIGIGIGLTLRLILGFPLQSLKDYLKQRKERNRIVEDSGIVQTENVNQEQEADEVIVVNKEESEILSTSPEEGKDPILTSNEKVALVVGGLLLLASVAIIVLSALSGLAGFQIILLTTFGGAGLSFSLPLVLSGIIKIAAKLKMRGLESRRNRQGKIAVLDDKIISNEELKVLSQADLKRVKRVDLNAWGVLNKKKEEIEGQKMGILFGAISILIGVAVILLPLIPVIAPFSAALLAVGTPFIIVGFFLTIGELIDYLKKKMEKIRTKRINSRKKLNNLLNEVGSNPADLEADLNLSPEWLEIA